jgi:hypothetical protein
VYKPLAHFRLGEVGPDGSLVLVHDKQNLVLTVPVPDDLADLPDVVADALAHVRGERRRLKKAEQPRAAQLALVGVRAPLSFF